MYAGYIALIVLFIVALISGITIHLMKNTKKEKILTILIVIFLVSITCIFIFGLCTLCIRIGHKQEIAEFEGTRDLCEQLIKDGEYNENIGLTSTIIDVNRWLVQAQSSIKTWGYNSSYYGLGIEDLKPITIR